MLPSHEMQRPVLEFCSSDFPTLDAGLSIGQALDSIRASGLKEKIIYFYVTGQDNVLKGVLPARRLLTEPIERPVSECMIKHVLAIPQKATLLEACEFFVLHKFLAFPVVDEKRRILGVLDVSVFTEEVLDLAEHERMDDIFQSLGVRASELRSASPAKAFMLRFPWLIATIFGGTVCALLAGAFSETLEQQILLAFFLTLVLGLGESVSAQSLAVTLQVMHRTKPTLVWLIQALRKEFLTAILLGSACGVVVGGIVLTWHHDSLAAASVGLSIFFAMVTACLLGVLIPSLSRFLRLDPKIAAGPLTLALADICTLTCYFGLAKLLHDVLA